MPTVQKQPLENIVLSQLRQAITNGTFKSGTHLTETKLSKLYNVSRTPVREALSQLTAEGLVEMIPNRGAFVAAGGENNTEHTKAIYSCLVGLSVHDLEEKTAKELAIFLRQGLNNLLSPGEAFEETRIALHQMIVGATKNTALKHTLQQLEARLPQPLFAPAQTTEEVQHISQTYVYLCTALARYKLDAAEKTARALMNLQIAAKTAHSSERAAAS